MNVSFLGLEQEYAQVRDEAQRRVAAVLDSGRFVLGDATDELEAACAELAGVEYAIACSSGSDALYLAMLAHGIGPGHAVVLPSFTFFATAGAVARAGAVPVMADVDPQTLNLDALRLSQCLEREFHHRPGKRLMHRHSHAELRAVIVVHLYGRKAPMPELLAAAHRLGVPVIEDAAQAIGAGSGRERAGGLGSIGCLSFYPTKNLGGAGDGGMLTTADTTLAASLRKLRVHGGEPGSYYHETVGINARMGELQAAYLCAKLARLEAWTQARRQAALWYYERLAGLEERGLIALPPPGAAATEHVYHQFVVRVPEHRDLVNKRMAEAGVETRVFYPLPLHLQPCFAGLGYQVGDLPISEAAAADVLALPMGIHLNEAAVDAVATALERAAAG